jgi:S-(hydroxymethyl)glutathione dehydrogenase/alcohol dehydrogenase
LCSSPELKRDPEAPPRLSQNGAEIHQLWNLSSFAEQMLIHEHALVKIRKDMPLDRAALIGCAVMTGVGAVFHTARVEPGTTVAIIGCGGIGLSAINGAALAGAQKIIAIDPVPSKLDLAKEFGATDCINASDPDPVDQVKELTDGGVHYSFEAVGQKTTAEQSFEMLRPRGTATIIGMLPMGTKIELHAPNFGRERKIQGYEMGSNHFRLDMPRLINFYLDGKLNLEKMISQHINLNQINEAFEELKTGQFARSVIIFDQ